MSAPRQHPLPAGVQVLQRGWLSSNTVVMAGAVPSVVDSGYVRHAPQTVALVEQLLGPAGPALLLNTHLHSDHCGGNAALQARWPRLRTWIPPGLAPHVHRWDAQALGYGPTGQECPPFGLSGTLRPGSTWMLGDWPWQVCAAPGHDPHSVVLWQPEQRTLISADALWSHGFGVVFPEIDGPGAFAEVAQTLDVIEDLAPRVVIPGHGAVFTDVADALQRARTRLRRFIERPDQHRRYAAKVLLKFKLLDAQALARDELLRWAHTAALLQRLHQQDDTAADFAGWVLAVADQLVAGGAARWQGDRLLNAEPPA